VKLIEPYTTTHDSIPAETGKNDGDGTSDDCISRQAAKDIFTELYGISAIGSVFDKYEWADICETTANELPSIQPEREKGEWVYNSPVTMKCNRCGLVIKDWDWHRFKICPNCGADMRGEKG